MKPTALVLHPLHFELTKLSFNRSIPHYFVKVLYVDFKIIYTQSEFISPVTVYLVTFFVQSFTYITSQLMIIILYI